MQQSVASSMLSDHAKVYLHNGESWDGVAMLYDTALEALHIVRRGFVDFINFILFVQSFSLLVFVVH